MGGIMSGNPNCKTHESINRFISLDSFQFNKALNQTRFPLKGKDEMFHITVESNHLTILFHIVGATENTEQYIPFDTIPNNFGGVRAYFLCPFCGERYRKLYLYSGKFRCRKCAKLNYPSQQVTKGMDAAALRLKKAALAISPDAANMSPHYLTRYRPDRPKGMHLNTYYRRLKAFYTAVDEYNAAFIKACGAILGRAPPSSGA